LQARATKYILARLYPTNFPEDFARRIRGWVKLPLWGLEVQIQGHLTILAQFSKAVINSVLKTWLNGWPTNFRMHYPVRSCVCCQSSTDRLLHLITCPSLMNTARSRSFCLLHALHPQLNEAKLDCSLLETIGLRPDMHVADVRAAFISLHVALDAYQNIRDSPNPDIAAQTNESVRQFRMRSLGPRPPKSTSRETARGVRVRRSGPCTEPVPDVDAQSPARESNRRRVSGSIPTFVEENVGIDSVPSSCAPAARESNNTLNRNPRSVDLASSAAVLGIRMPNSFGGLG
jgi:hypothetical protein